VNRHFKRRKAHCLSQQQNLDVKRESVDSLPAEDLFRSTMPKPLKLTLCIPDLQAGHRLCKPMDWQQIEIAKIQQHRPAVIIIDDWKINGTEQSRFSHWATQTTKFIENRYRLVATINGKKIFALLTPSL
jgi:hypothetical protein